MVLELHQKDEFGHSAVKLGVVVFRSQREINYNGEPDMCGNCGACSECSHPRSAITGLA